jgi:hypothetical protein
MLAPTFILAYIVLATLPLLQEVDLSDAVIAALLFLLLVGGALVGSALFAAASIVFSVHADGSASSLRGALSSLKPLARDVIAAALFSAILSMLALSLLGFLGVLLQPLFVGPPIVIQVIAIERLRLRDAWPRTRTIAAGSWVRIFGTLIGVVLGLALALLAIFGLVDAATSTAGDAIRLVAFVAAQGLVAGLTHPLLAAAQFVLYRDLTERGAETPSAA